MTCFVGHLRKKGYFDALGVEVTKENAKEIEREIARIVGVKDGHCPEIWKEMKAWLEDPKKKAKLDAALRKRFAPPKR
ncbi:MAG: hypothetical protein MUC90_03660 [Thermoplasmata archaeon]|jgi:hypothetical protein|nr:hypothetical protein [Thermoplasmata archaeon]